METTTTTTTTITETTTTTAPATLAEGEHRLEYIYLTADGVVVRHTITYWD